MRLWVMLLWCLGVASPVFATPRAVVFWYPGETGTALQAQPLLDQFTALLELETPGVDWRAIYIPVEDKGVSVIRSQHPVFGIVSYAMYWKYRTALDMTPIAATRLLPGGATTEQLALMTGSCRHDHGTRSVYASQPFSLAFLRALFPAQQASLAPWPSGNTGAAPDIRRILQQTAESGSCDLIVVSGAEQASLKALKAAWIAQLHQVALSDPIPTPLVVRFGADPQADTVSGALFTLAARREAKPVLQEMRLAGFAPYQSR